MARIRTLKPEFWADEKLAPLDALTRLVFLGLISMADDAGRLVDSVKQLDGMLFPQTDDTCGPALESLASASRIIRYVSESGQRLIQIAHWARHQRVDHPNAHVLPGPSELASTEPYTPAAVAVSSRAPRESLANASRAPRATTSTSTNDQGPLAARKPRRDAGDSRWPHFPRASCDRLYGVWSDRLGRPPYSRFRNAFGPLFPADPPYTLDQLEGAIGLCIRHAIKADESQFCTPEKFVARVQYWVDQATPVLERDPQRAYDLGILGAPNPHATVQP